MKYKFIVIILPLFFLISCSKEFIDLSPENVYAPDDFYKNDVQLKQAYLAAYVPLRDLLLNDYFASEMHSDNTHYQANPSNRGTANVYRESVADWLNDGNNDYTNAIYYHCYTGISRANILLDRLPQATAATVAGKTNAEGQAKFIRAFNYFKLVRLFGEVPLHLKETAKADDAFLLRSPVADVYNQIITDCKDAIEKLPPPTFPATGEATKGSATVLLADVFVTLKRYAEAETLLNTLPAMGYQLLSTYSSVFLPANKNSRESLFEVQFLGGQDGTSTPNPIPFQYLPRVASGSNLNLIVGSNIAGGGGWNKPTTDLIANYELNDPRLDASIRIAEGTYNSANELTISAEKPVAGYVAPAGKTGQPYIRKFIHPPYTVAGNTNENFPVYRYAEVLLLLAESLNEQGKPAQALVPLNAVRARARAGAVAGTLPDITTNDQTALRDIIFKERRIELAFENKRFQDLQRNPKGLAIMQTYSVKGKQYPYVSSTAFDIQPYKFLLAIPRPERELNPGLTQNPGYTF